MKKIFTLIALLAVAVSGAWAEDVPYQISSSESAYTDQSNATTNFNGKDQTQLSVYYTQFRDWGSNDGTVKVNAGGKIVFYKFPLSSLSSAEGTFKSASVKIHGKSSDASKNADLQRFLGYNAEWSASTITNNTVSNSAGAITGLVTSAGSFQPLDSRSTYSVSPKGSDITLDATTYVGSAIENDKAYVTIAVVANTTRTSYYDTTAELTVVYSTADVIKYSVKFVDMDGNELKSDLTNQEALAGENVVIPNEWKASFIKDDVKYIYDSNDAPATYSEGAVITIKFREAARFSYAVTSNQNTEILSGTEYEGTNIAYAYSKFILKGTELFESARQGSNPWWGSSFVLDSNNKNIVINYNKTKDDVVFYSEAEDLAGASKATGSNADIRCSGKAGGYAGGNVTVTTLPAGKYRLYTSVWGNAGKTITFKAGEDVIGAFDTKGYIQDYNTEEIIIASETSITFSGTDASHPVDFVYIVKTADLPETFDVTISDAGYATFVAPYNVDFTDSGIEAFYVSSVDAANGTVTLSKVTTVPAGEAVIVKGKSGNVNVVASATPIVNELKAAKQDIAYDSEATNTNYVLANGQNGVGLYPVNEGIIAAGKGYLPVAKGGSAPSKGFEFVRDNATDAGVVEAAPAVVKNGKYTENGQIVIFINGKKYNVAGMNK